MKSKKHEFTTIGGYKVIIEHRTPFTRFTALKQLHKDNIILKNNK